MHTTTRNDGGTPAFMRWLTSGIIALSAVPLLIFPDLKFVGWFLLSAAVIVAGWHYPSRFSKAMLVLIGAIAVVGIMPITTDISYSHIAFMTSLLIVAVAVPYAATILWIKEPLIHFPWRAGRKWYSREIAYIVAAAVAAYLFLPVYLVSTDSYLNWSVSLDPSSVIRLLVGTAALGIWDELFFVGVCLGLLRHFLPFLWANIVQAALWTAFLYELGFRGWGPVVIFIFALSQGYIFKATKSLLYIVSVHLAIDFVLFLLLVHLHYPSVLPIFITSPL